jgi:putative hydrolase of HD superfamily
VTPNRSLQISFVARAEGADPERTVTMATLHDMSETRTGDIGYVGRHYVSATPNEEVTRDQAAGLPAATASAFVEIIAEMEDGKTAEALCARDADKLECLMQAREYEFQGHADVRGLDRQHARRDPHRDRPSTRRRRPPHRPSRVVAPDH